MNSLVLHGEVAVKRLRLQVSSLTLVLLLASSVAWWFSTSLNLFSSNVKKANNTVSAGVLLANKNLFYFKVSQRDLSVDIRWFVELPEGLKHQILGYVSRIKFRSH